MIARGSDIGKATTYVYDALGRVYQKKGANGQVLTFAYDGNGNVLSVTDALGHKTSYYYDALNRVVDVVDAAGGTTGYTYDADDHVTYVTDPRGLVTGYSWDGLGLLWQQRSPDTGTTDNSFDAYGRLASKTRADGSHLTYAYDALNRLVSVAGSGATRTYTWDSCTNGKGRLCTASSGATAVYNTYTPEGWLAARAFSITSGPVYSVGYSYNAMGQLTEVAYPDGNEALYDYSHGAVADVRLKVGASTVYGASSVDYRPMDMAMSSWTSYGGLSNTISYDSDLRPISIAVPNVESLAYSYDAANRIIKITNGLDSSMTQNFEYDALNRLLRVSSGADNESFSYDADGNRLNAMINGVGWTYTTAGNSNRLVHASNGSWAGSYQYDANGNMLGTSHQYWKYGPFNRLSTVIPYSGSPVTTYDTSAEGQRLRKYTASTSTYFAPSRGGVLMAEDIDGTWQDYVRLNGRLVAVMRAGGFYAVHTDQTGRPVAITDSNRDIRWRAHNFAFDRKIITNTWATMNIGFPGQYDDSADIASDGYWYNGKREYASYLGRYLESDPIGLAGGINTYVYTSDDPINMVDPLGLCPTCTQLQQQAAELADALEHTSHDAEAISAAGYLTAGIGAFFEPETIGIDTPVTVSGGAIGSAYAATATATGFAAAGLQMFASSGNPSAMTNFAMNKMVEMGTKLAVSDIPFASHFAENIGQLAGKAMELSEQAQKACETP